MESTDSAPSIVGHTTVSNPSWTAILTGAWNNKTGVINNVYTPTTYDRWPTVFTQLENTTRTSGRRRSPTGTSSAPSPLPANRRRRSRLHLAEPERPQLGQDGQAVTDETVETLEGPRR